MTPLAHHYAKQLTLPVKKRVKFNNEHGLDIYRLIENIHCFECSGVMPLVDELKRALHSELGKHKNLSSVDATLQDKIFLPAPNTWLEIKSKYRLAILLREEPEGDAASVYLFGPAGAKMVSRMHFSGFMRCWDMSEDDDVALDVVATVYCLLALVNTPRIIGRHQHMPNHALERRLTQSLGVGKFPLHAWTEIKLEVSKPIEIDDGEPHEAHLTGRRALHFCRAHIRLKQGRIEYVSSHWRGDPAIGIKQSRYVVTA